MNIPLDNLYEYLESLSGDVIIYHFYPHGSKKLADISPIRQFDATDRFSTMTKMPVICYDQEPLSYCSYGPDVVLDYIKNDADDSTNTSNINWQHHTPEYFNMVQHMNLRVGIKTAVNVWDKTILVHSEKRSKNLDLYKQNGFIPVYWWSHAIIARDWFRYAQIDPMLQTNTNIKYDFLIYNRAWTGTREYRLKMAELLVDQELHNCSLTSCSFQDRDCHYKDYKFSNPNLAIQRLDLENFFTQNTWNSNASAQYVAKDYNESMIEVVLETIFDDDRLQLTEKVLRPIACGKPFLLTSTQGSLEYLREYGFETFAPWIDETYDTIEDPLDRLTAIVNEMARIKQLNTIDKQQLSTELDKIAQRNKVKFFSDTFFQQVISEYQSNIKTAKIEMHKHLTGKWWRHIKDALTESYPEKIAKFRLENPHVLKANELLEIWIKENQHPLF